MEISNEYLAIAAVIAGLIFILTGANMLTDGAAAIAKRFKISNLVIGLTVVAFGTSAPELVVSVVSALNGSPDMAIGNVIGSNIFNTLLIVGCTAIIVPLFIQKSTLTIEIPFCILGSFVLLFCVSDIFLDNATVNIISRSDGLLLLCFFIFFFGYTLVIARNGDGQEEESMKEIPLWKSITFIGVGLAGLIYGGQFFVNGASAIARSMGISESVIGLTLVAGGTSLPELATSVVAAMKKNTNMAIGNVIGSNLFNIFLILGCASVIHPLEVQGIKMLDFGVMIGSCILLFLLGLFFRRQVLTRWKGIVMLVCFFTYMTYLVINA